MFGLSFEKLFLVAILAGLVIGPQRLPLYTHRLAELIRSFRSFVDASKARAETEIGISRAELEALDVRQYDPRRIVRTALTEKPPTPASAEATAEAAADLEAEATRVRPGQKYLVTGGSAHPRRILISSLPEDDPRRIAAHVPPPAEDDETERLMAEVNQLLVS
ncbi:sec-independent protein translocase protein TatB [Nocardioides sp. YR527]|uniref:Sec-independent protein translocase subunit TatA/TatB n=1 Tax=Nocardioides sp. YR527 TaxID=1881028 RepID=UPI000886AE20|nr:hypothetical protein [Nocardioides sp. YR527]SDL16257.1 sec-independent protein translocase protein TatB [Nocardioides sp. YR527]